jgi:transposase
MPKHYDAEVKARAVRLVTEHKVESGSVTKSCEAVGRRLGISKETLRGGVAKLRSMPVSARGSAARS